MQTVPLHDLGPRKRFRFAGRKWRVCQQAPFKRQFVGGCAIEFVPVETKGSNFIHYLHGCEAVQIKS